MFEFIKDPTVKKVIGIVSAVAAGLVAVSNTLSDRKKEQEFEDMKKAISELQNK